MNLKGRRLRRLSCSSGSALVSRTLSSQFREKRRRRPGKAPLMASFITRKEERFRESVPVQYHGEQITGEGFVYDLSLSGGRIVGNVPVLEGMLLVLRFSLPGEVEPFAFEGATVRWVRGLEFGVELGPLPPDLAERFRHVIAVFAEKHSGPLS